MRRLAEFVTDNRLTLTEEMDMSTLVGATITGTGGIVLARVRRLSPTFYFSDPVPVNDPGYFEEALAANGTAGRIAAYLTDYFNPPKEGTPHDTGAQQPA